MRPSFYQPSGRIPVATAPLLLAAIACAGLFALPYAWITIRSDWIVSVFFTFVFAFVMAGLVHIACRAGKVRNPGVMRQFGLAVGVSGWAFQWIFWIVFAHYDSLLYMPGQSLAIPLADLFADPGAFAGALGSALDATDWIMSDRHQLIRYAAWCAELAVLASAPAAIGHAQAGRPFCEVSGRWAKASGLPQHFAAGHLMGAREHFASHPEQLLAALTPLTDLHATHARVTLFRAKSDCYVSVKIVGSNDGGSTQAQVVVEYLRVPGRAVDGFLERLARPAPQRTKAPGKKPRRTG